MRVTRTNSADPSNDVTFETPDDVKVTLRPVPDSTAPPRRQTRGPSGRPSSDPLLEALKAASGLEVAADARLELPARRTTRAIPESARVSVGVEPTESAVLLVETDGGTYAWLQPDEVPAGGRSTRGAEANSLTFTLGATAVRSRATRSLIGSVINRLTKPVRIVVLRFVARVAIDTLTSRLERNNPTGLVRIGSAELQSWKPGHATIPPAPEGRLMRVLLLVHGTFSNTAGSFGHLSTHPAGEFFLQSALEHYDAVLGFDHKTLGESVETNAQQMTDALAALPQGTQIDAIAFSRGGLVLRALFDEQLAGRRPDVRLNRAIFVGCTNAGTSLANPANWAALADVYTNIIMAGARVATLLAGAPLDPFVQLGIKTMGEFVQIIPEVAITEKQVPGLASMLPGGETVSRLAKPSKGDATSTYYAVTSNFAPRFEPDRGLSKELAQLLLDRVTKDLWEGQANDLVVDTKSMTDLGAKSDWINATYDFGNVETIYHTVYFTAPETCDRLLAWLDLPALPIKLKVARRTRTVDTPVPSVAPPNPAPGGRSPIFRGSAAIPSFSRKIGSSISRFDSDTVATSRTGSSISRFDSDRLAPSDASPSALRKRSARRTRSAKTAGSAGTVGAKPSGRKVSRSTPEAAACHVAASMPETPKLSEPALLTVTLSREEIASIAGEARADAVVTVLVDTELEVIVIARTNCSIVDENSFSVSPPTAGRPVALEFKVQGTRAGSAELWVDFYQDNRRLTRLVLQPVFVSTGEIAASAVITPKDVDPPIVDLRILEEGNDNEWRLRFLISAPELNIENEYFSDWKSINKPAYITSLYKDLENSWASTKGEFSALMRLVQAAGAEMFRGLLPEDMQRLIWDLRKQIGSLQIFAQEPSIPWEVAFIAEPGEPLSKTEGKFFSELGLTRWITNVGVAPAKLRLRNGKAIYCIPDYLDDDLKLPGQPDEVAMVTSMLGAMPVEAHIEPVLSLLDRTARQDFDVLHFACHGTADPARIWESGLLLQGFKRDGGIAREELTLAAVRNYTNLASEGMKPLIFLNACQTAVGGYSLTGAGGLAQAFVRGGAGLFVGTLWSVEDRAALQFSKTFYATLKDGSTVVQAARKAREAAKEKNESTWLAYSVYGHPYARASTDEQP